MNTDELLEIIRKLEEENRTLKEELRRLRWMLETQD